MKSMKMHKQYLAYAFYILFNIMFPMLFRLYVYRDIPSLPWIFSRLSCVGMVAGSYYISFFSAVEGIIGFHPIGTLTVPLSIYALISHTGQTQNCLIFFIGISLVISAFTGGLFIFSGIISGKSRKELRRHRLAAIRSAATIFSYVMTVALIMLIAHRINSTMKPSTGSTELMADRSYPLVVSDSDKKEVILQFQEELWDTYNRKKKLDLLQQLEALEIEHLGVPYPVNVRVADLDEQTLGNYNPSKHMISIDIDALDNSSMWRVVEILTHESRHAWQHAFTDAWNNIPQESQNLYGLRFASIMDDEFQNYESDSFEEYYSQQVEEDARDYARQEVLRYNSLVKEFLNSIEAENCQLKIEH